MGRLYFVAPHSNNKNNKGQHRTTIILLYCPLLSLVVLCWAAQVDLQSTCIEY